MKAPFTPSVKSPNSEGAFRQFLLPLLLTLVAKPCAATEKALQSLPHIVCIIPEVGG
jgi:hypothetical protein